MISDYKQAKSIIEKYAFLNGWTFPHNRDSVDLLVALQNMQEIEENDELPHDVRPAFRVVMHSFAKLFDGGNDE
jgi:hypothetical protein